MTSASTTGLAARGTARERRRARTAELLEQAATTRGERRKQLLDEVVVENMSVARAIAARYRGRGVALDDLEQVAHTALIRCVHKFDPRSADDLLSYAVPSIRGELRRYFRDHGWMVRPPRRVQELQSQVVEQRDRLSGVGESHGAEQIAATLGVPVSDVHDALAAQGCFQPMSLDLPMGDGESSALGDLIVADDATDPYGAAETRVMLAAAVRSLSERERRLIHLRFFEGLTQSEIAAEFAVTQTQISRLLSNLLARLRDRIGAVGDTETSSHRRAAAA